MPDWIASEGVTKNIEVNNWSVKEETLSHHRYITKIKTKSSHRNKVYDIGNSNWHKFGQEFRKYNTQRKKHNRPQST